MEYRHLGRSGLKISEIAYGNWLTHGSQIEEDAARSCVAAALDEGITTFDTADAYAGTRAEEVLGRALHGVRRESVEIFTKVFWPTGGGVNDRGLSRKHIMESAHASLRRLQTDYVDLYQAHRYDHETPLEETLRAIEAEVVPLCEKEGIGQLVFSPIAQGVLTGKYLPGADAPAGSRAADESGAAMISRFLTDGLLARVQELSTVADEAGLSLAQLAIAWTLQNLNVAAAIVGATRPDQVRDNVGASGVRLDAGLRRRIDDILGPEIVTDPARTASPPSRP